MVRTVLGKVLASLWVCPTWNEVGLRKSLNPHRQRSQSIQLSYGGPRNRKLGLPIPVGSGYPDVG
jgi:hypothetical protein